MIGQTWVMCSVPNPILLFTVLIVCVWIKELPLLLFSYLCNTLPKSWMVSNFIILMILWVKNIDRARKAWLIFASQRLRPNLMAQMAGANRDISTRTICLGSWCWLLAGFLVPLLIASAGAWNIPDRFFTHMLIHKYSPQYRNLKADRLLTLASVPQNESSKSTR